MNLTTYRKLIHSVRSLCVRLASKPADRALSLKRLARSCAQLQCADCPHREPGDVVRAHEWMQRARTLLMAAEVEDGSA